MRTISMKIPEELDRSLTELARRRGETRSAVIRAAIEAAVRVETGSVGQAVVDLAGILDGPEDLSCSSRHLAGYGEE